MAADGGGQRRDDRMIAGRPLIYAIDRFAPPLQTDLPQHGLGHDFTNFRNFQIEGIEGIERAACLARYAGADRIMIAVVLFHLIRTIGGRLI